MKKKTKRYSEYQQSMFNKYAIDESYLQTGKQRRACLDLLETIDRKQNVDDQTIIQKIAATFQGSELHKKVASCVTVAALLSVLQTTPAMALASADYQPKAEASYSAVLPDEKSVKLDSDSYLDRIRPAQREVKTTSLHLVSNQVLANPFEILGDNGVLIDGDSDVAVFTKQETKTLTVIDTDLEDWGIIRDAVNEGEVLLLNDEETPLNAILKKLQEMGSVDCLNIVSHGESGKLKFENSVIDAKTLEANKDQWKILGSYLSREGDIQLFGCNIAKGDEGKAFIETLAEITGADVAASINPTGSESKGGDWTLEAVVGDVAGNLPFAKDAIGKFMGVLFPTTASHQFTFTGTAGAYTFTDGTPSLNNNYFTVSGKHVGTTDEINISGSSAYFWSESVNTNFEFKIEATDALKSFVLDDIDLGLGSYAISNNNSLSNVCITGTKVGGGIVSVGPVILQGTSNSVLNKSDFSDWSSKFADQQLTSVVISAYAGGDNTYGTGSLLFNSFTVSNMTPPGPAAPSTPDLSAASDTGTSSTDNNTSNTTPTFTGTAVASSTVTLYDTDGTPALGSTTADESGNWSITSSALSEGTHSITAKATDGSGTSSASSALSVTIDTTAPSAPAAPDLLTSSDSGTSSSDDVTNDTTPTLTGTGAEANSTVTVSSSIDGILGTATADGSGTWNFTPSSPITAGTHSITATATDAAGNVSAASSALSVTIDTEGPTTTITGVSFSNDTGSSSADFITKTAAQTISGTLSASLATGDTVMVSLDNGTTWAAATATVGQNTWSLSGQTLSGSNTLKVKVIDAAGNDGTVYSQAYTLDITAPTTTIASVSFSDDTGVSSTDFITKTAAQTISGTLSANLAAGETVEVSLDNGSNWVTATAAEGQNTWSLSGQTLSGSNTLKVKVIDAAGNDGAIKSQAYVLATTAPTTTIATMILSADTGISSTDFITKTAGQTISGTLSSNLASGEIVEVSIDNGSTWVTATATVGESTWSLAGQTLAGISTLKVRVTSLAGLSGTETSQAYVLDTTSPTTTIASAIFSADTGIPGDFITKTAAQIISGTLSANLASGETVMVSLDNGGTWTPASATVGQNTWSLSGQTLTGSDTLKVKVIDAAGNDGTVYSQTYTLDTTGPAITFSGLSFSADTGSSSTDFITKTAAQTISATLSGAPAGTDKVYGSLDNGDTWTDITGKVSGTTLTWDGVTLTGSNTLMLKVTDVAGNDGTIKSQAYVLATTAPTTTIATMAFSDDTGVSSTDFITKTAAQTISGTLGANLAAGEIVEVSLDNGSTWATATATVGQSTWSLAGQTLAGSSTLQARVTSLAGLSGTETSQAYVLDTTSPTTTIASAIFSADTGIPGDFITKTAAQIISGTLSANLASGETVMVSLDNGGTWTPASATVGQNTWSLSGQTLSGSNTLKVKVIDAAGNDGTVYSQTYTLDTTGPDITFSGLSFSADTGSSSTDFITKTAAQTISATLSGAPAVTDKVYGSLDNGATWTDITGKVSGTTLTWDGVTLTGSNTLMLKVTDVAGNDGTVKSQAYVLATTAPTTTIATMAFSDDTGVSSTDFITKTAAQTISGTLSTNLAAGEIVEVSLDNGSTWATATATVGQSTWSLAGQTLAGSSTLQVRVTSLAGLSGTEASQVYVLDTTVPTITFSGLSFSADTGSSSTDFITKTAAQTIYATLSGTLDASDKVYGSIDNGGTWTDITSKVSGTTLTWDGITLAGSDTLKLKVTDAAGNDGAVCSQNYTLDTTGPAITFSGLSFSADTGSSSTDFITKTAAQTISATLSGAPAGTDKVYSSLDNGATWTDITGKVSGTTLTWDGVTLTGSNTLMLKVTDVAGNDGTANSQDYVLDTTAPIAPMVTSATSVTNDKTPEWTWTAGGGGCGVFRHKLDNSDLTSDATETTTPTYTHNTLLSEGSHTLYVQERDAAGNWSASGSYVVIVDVTAPAFAGGGTITANNATSSSINLSWTVATDALTMPSNLQYKVVYSTSNNISTVSDAETNGTLSKDWTANQTSATVTGLTASKDYYFNVLVKDAAGNKAVYSPVTGKTTAAPSGGGGGGSSSTTTSTSTVVEVNGQKQDAGTANSQTTGGQTVTTITVDDTKLNKILETKGENPTVTLPTNTATGVVVGELNGQTVKNMEAKEATLEIKTGTVSYTLPASQINIDAVSSQIGSQVELKDIKVSVKIAEPPADTVKVVEDTAKKNSYQIVVKPVEFEISCTSGNKTVEVSKFNGYVERTIAIPDGVDPSKITTGIVLNADGTFRHVPTQVIKIDGKYYAKIQSLTNSTYSVIWNPVEFTDVVNYWAQAAINDMGSRMVVSGDGTGKYNPSQAITRAEFAAIVVRAMGLAQGTTESSFGDVALGDWFNGYVDTASAYGLISGYDAQVFGPNDTITREQAMAIIARAMQVTKLEVNVTESEMKDLLAKCSDGTAVSDYAKKSVAQCLKSGIVNGTTSNTIAPKDQVTRAEVAVMVQHLLQKSNLINK